MDIYVQKGGQQRGPFSEAKVRQGIDAGDFAPTDLAWTTGKASWHPLSVLIHLDVQRPPPLSSVEQPPPLPSSPAVTPEAKLGGQVLQPVEQPSTDVQKQKAFATKINAPARPPTGRTLGQRSCRLCGAPYNLFSLTHAWGSGLCRRCSKANEKPRQESICFRPISTRQDALKAVSATAIFYLVLGIINFVLAQMEIVDSFYLAYLMVIASFALWIAHSRIAAIVLFLIPIVCMLLLILMGEGQEIIDMGYWNVVTVFQVALAWKATVATFKLHRGFVIMPLSLVESADRGSTG